MGAIMGAGGESYGKIGAGVPLSSFVSFCLYSIVC